MSMFVESFFLLRCLLYFTAFYSIYAILPFFSLQFQFRQNPLFAIGLVVQYHENSMYYLQSPPVYVVVKQDVLCSHIVSHVLSAIVT